MDLGKAIKICRTHKGITRSALAKRSGLSASYISLLEKGERDPAISKVNKIADALNIPLSILLFIGSNQRELAGVLSEDALEKLASAALKLVQASDQDGQESLI